MEPEVTTKLGIAFVSERVFTSVQHPLQEACGWDWIPFKHTEEVAGDGDILVAVLPFVGDFPCQLRAVFRPVVAESVAKNFFGFEIASDGDDMIDTLGEILNVIAGDLSARLDGDGLTVQMSLPTVIRGSDIEFTSSPECEESWAQFRTPDGEILVGVVSSTEEAPDIDSPIDIEDVEAFLSEVNDVVAASFVETLTEACGWQEAASIHADPIPACNCVAGILGFAGTVPWHLRAVFRNEEAARVASSMMGFELDPGSEDLLDAVGEVVNVVAGDISARLGARGIQAALGLPTTLAGVSVELSVPRGQSVHRTIIATPVGAFWAEVIHEG